jgi:8-oxo-dGTP pyrophosphatase MutT (NUDIX family)
MPTEWPALGLTPSFERLAARDGVQVRETERELDAPAFERAEARVENGLGWGVGAVAWDDDGRLLLVKEDGRWLTPGGEVEAGESHEAALVREVREETGIQVSVETLAAVNAVTLRHDGATTAFAFAHYLAQPASTTLADDPGLPDEDIEAVEWHETVPTETIDRELLVDLHED